MAGERKIGDNDGMMLLFPPVPVDGDTEVVLLWATDGTLPVAGGGFRVAGPCPGAEGFDSRWFMELPRWFR